ncbi:MAG: DUF1559 domain-containing protein [Pirellulales bacterium]
MQVSFEKLARNPPTRPIYEAIKSNPGYREWYGIPAHRVRDMTVMLTVRSIADRRARVVFRTRDTITDETIKWGGLAGSDTRKFAGGMYQLSRKGIAWWPVDRDAIVMDDEAGLRKYLENQDRRRKPPAWLVNTSELSTKAAWLAADPSALATMATGALPIGGDPAVLRSWNATRSLVASIDFNDRLLLRVTVEAADATAAQDLETAAISTLNSLRNGIESPIKSRTDPFQLALALLTTDPVVPFSNELLANAKVDRHARQIEIATQARFDVETCRKLVALPTHFFETTLRIDEKSRAELLFIATAHKLNAIALGMYGYLGVNGQLPPAVIIGPDGKTPHSWRVALLPFLDESDLYRQYRLNEPWDSPHNSKLLEQAPDVFRAPEEAPDSVDTCYFVLRGADTLFAGDRGMVIDDPNGTEAQSILVVESRRGVPWTKPDDVPFDIAKPFPKLGGIHKNLFFVITANGRILGYSPHHEESKLKMLAARHAGKPEDEPEARKD